MSLMDVANELVNRVREGKGTDLLNTLYAENVQSVEAWSPEGTRVTEGIEGLRGKHAWWDENMESHSMDVEGPFPHGDDKFAVIYDVDATDKNDGRRFQMREVAVYHVADGRITREEFYYAPPG